MVLDVRFDTDREASIVNGKKLEIAACNKRRNSMPFVDPGKLNASWFAIGPNNPFNHCAVIRMHDEKKYDPQKTYYVLVVTKRPRDKGYNESELEKLKHAMFQRVVVSGSLCGFVISL